MLQLKTLAQGEEPIIYLLRHLEKKNVFIDEAMKQLSKWQCVVDFFATPGARQMVNASIGDSISLSVLRFLKKQLHERRITEY